MGIILFSEYDSSLQVNPAVNIGIGSLKPNIGINTTATADVGTITEIGSGIGINVKSFIHPNLPEQPILLSADIGIGSQVITKNYNASISTHIGIGNSISINRDCVTDIAVGIALGSSINILNSTAINSINAGIGIGCRLKYAIAIDADINSGVGISGIIVAQKETQVNILSSIGIGCRAFIDSPINEECNVPDFASMRWC